MPPLNITSSDLQKAQQEFQRIEQRVETRMEATAHKACANTIVERAAAYSGIKLREVPQITHDSK